MNNAEITAMATAVDVLHEDRHRPPLGQVSPTAAAVRDAEEVDPFIPTWRGAALTLAGLVVFWVFYVCIWAIFGGAA